MATVITNLLSAIPVFGKDLVESGNLIQFSNMVENFMTWREAISSNFFYILQEGQLQHSGGTEVFRYLLAFPPQADEVIVKQDYAAVPIDIKTTVLATIGTVNVNALKKGKKIRTESAKREEYLSLPSEFIAFLVGLIDGDGYIRINKTTKGYIALNLVIILNVEDISTLEYIYSVLKRGKITKYPDYKHPICKLVINRTDLQEVLFPLMKHHNIFFLTDSRRAQFDLAMLILLKEIKLYDQIPYSYRSALVISPLKQEGKQLKHIPLSPMGYNPFSPLSLSSLHCAVCSATRRKMDEEKGVGLQGYWGAEQYLSLPFFKNWLVGFTNAEGSFFIKRNNDGCFQLKQRIHEHLFEAIKVLFNTNRELHITAPQQNKYAQFSVSSKKDIQTVINFFSFSGLHPLIGLKSIQYFKWLTNLRNSKRYQSLNYPCSSTCVSPTNRG